MLMKFNFYTWIRPFAARVLAAWFKVGGNGTYTNTIVKAMNSNGQWSMSNYLQTSAYNIVKISTLAVT